MTREFATDVADAIENVAVQHGLDEDDVEVDLETDPMLVYVEGTADDARVELTTAISGDLQAATRLEERTVLPVGGQGTSERNVATRSLGCEVVLPGENGGSRGHIGPIRDREELENVVSRLEAELRD